MNLTRPSEIRALLDRLGMRPRKALGQHFLIDRNILDILVETAALEKGDTVMEVGPGLGTVTERLLAAGAEVVAVEKDARMVDWLKERFAGVAGLSLLHEDALHTDWNRLLSQYVHAKVVANLPYAVGSRILIDWAMADQAPARIVVTVQMEVGRRLTAAPGCKDYGLLGVWMRRRYDTAIVKSVSRTCFLPPPTVASAIVRMDRHDRFPMSAQAAAAFRKITGMAFRQRRKQLATSLSHPKQAGGMTSAQVGGILESMGLNPRSRPEELTVEAWSGFVERVRSVKSVDRGEPAA